MKLENLPLETFRSSGLSALFSRVFHLQATGPAIRFLYNWRSSNEMRLPTRIFFFLPFFRLHETNEFAVSDRILRRERGSARKDKG